MIERQQGFLERAKEILSLKTARILKLIHASRDSSFKTLNVSDVSEEEMECYSELFTRIEDLKIKMESLRSNSLSWDEAEDIAYDANGIGMLIFPDAQRLGSDMPDWIKELRPLFEEIYVILVSYGYDAEMMIGRINDKAEMIRLLEEDRHEEFRENLTNKLAKFQN